MELIFATNNLNKINEIQSGLTNNQFKIYTLKEEKIEIEIPEPYNTLEKNAEHKVNVITAICNKNIFAEDTGLLVDCLGGEPGVFSARYAGEECDTKKNIQKLLSKMTLSQNRKAHFKTVICCYINKNKHFFSGVCEGEITVEPKGNQGFGYDPIFIPDGSTLTFAEMSLTEKKMFSHRQKALNQLIDFLNIL